jgi:DNA-directed RNA polymerase
MVQNKWKNLDKPKEDESVTDYQKRVKAFEKFDRASRDVMKLLLSEGNELYLTHKVDKRGRTYCQGYQVNYQGTPWCKATVEFHKKELI